jgi:hypothetical protein
MKNTSKYLAVAFVAMSASILSSSNFILVAAEAPATSSIKVNNNDLEVAHITISKLNLDYNLNLDQCVEVLRLLISKRPPGALIPIFSNSQESILNSEYILTPQELADATKALAYVSKLSQVVNKLKEKQRLDSFIQKYDNLYESNTDAKFKDVISLMKILAEDKITTTFKSTIVLNIPTSHKAGSKSINIKESSFEYDNKSSIYTVAYNFIINYEILGMISTLPQSEIIPFFYLSGLKVINSILKKVLKSAEQASIIIEKLSVEKNSAVQKI